MRKPLLTLLILMMSSGLAGCGDDAGSPFDLTTTAAPSTTAATSTTAAATTAATTATTAATTTTTQAPEPTLGPPPLPLVFLMDGLNIVAFGASPPNTINVVGSYLGLTPTFDSAWVAAAGDFGICPGTEYRQVEFGGLTLRFTDGDLFQPAGTRHFFAWAYDGDPADITPALLDVGITVADLQALYPAVQLFGDDPLFGSTFRIDGPHNGEQLWGTLTGVGPADTIKYLTGGWGCGE